MNTNKPKKTTRKKNSSESELIRLNKFIADAGYCSRRKADELISAGVVKVNGALVTELGAKVHPSDLVTIKGDPVSIKEHNIYIVLNKPKDVITTTADEKNRKTVLDIVRKQTRIFPVGRLDRNTTGVLLLTNDGELAHRLTHPSYEIPRQYAVKLDKALKPADAQKIADGLEIDGEKMAPCDIIISQQDKTKVFITLTEGKNHEVKRIFEFVGYEVKQLDRKSYAGITYKGLEKGRYRHLTRKEVLYLKKLVGIL